MQRAKDVFERWSRRLADDEEMFGLRWFAPGGGLIWRNRLAREFYATFGFFSSDTTAWSAVKKYLTASELRRLNHFYATAFATDQTVLATITGRVPGWPACITLTKFVAIYGDLRNGVLLTHLSPLSSLPLRRLTAWPQSSPPSVSQEVPA